MIFDLDETLVNSREAVAKTFKYLSERYAPNVTPLDFHNVFKKIAIENFHMLKDFESYSKLGFGPFDLFYSTTSELPFRRLSVVNYREKCIKELSATLSGTQWDYLEFTGTMHFLRTRFHEEIEGTKETLEALEDYNKVVMTNGFVLLQFEKLTHASLQKYFIRFFASEMAGIGKPDEKFYRLVMSEMGTTKSTSIMIGDNPWTDIQGGLNVGMRSIYLNRFYKDIDLEGHEEINHISELIHKIEN